MSFKASNPLPSQAYESAKSRGRNLKVYAENTADIFAGGANSITILDMVDVLQSYRDSFNQVITVPGIQEYAKEQEDDVGYDFIAETNSLIVFINNGIQTVINNFPATGGWLDSESFNPGGDREPRDFSGSSLAPMIAALNAIDNAIV